MTKTRNHIFKLQRPGRAPFRVGIYFTAALPRCSEGIEEYVTGREDRHYSWCCGKIEKYETPYRKKIRGIRRCFQLFC